MCVHGCMDVSMCSWVHGCEYVFMGVNVCSWVHEYVHACMWEPEVDLGILPQLLFKPN